MVGNVNTNRKLIKLYYKGNSAFITNYLCSYFLYKVSKKSFKLEFLSVAARIIYVPVINIVVKTNCFDLESRNFIELKLKIRHLHVINNMEFMQPSSYRASLSMKHL